MLTLMFASGNSFRTDFCTARAPKTHPGHVGESKATNRCLSLLALKCLRSGSNDSASETTSTGLSRFVCTRPAFAGDWARDAPHTSTNVRVTHPVKSLGHITFLHGKNLNPGMSSSPPGSMPTLARAWCSDRREHGHAKKLGGSLALPLASLSQWSTLRVTGAYEPAAAGATGAVLGLQGLGQVYPVDVGQCHQPSEHIRELRR